MFKQTISGVLAIAAVQLLSGCASIVSGTQQSVSVDAIGPSGEAVVGATCKLANGDGTWFVTAPGSTVVDRAYSALIVTCQKQGYVEANASAQSSTKAIVFGNIFIGGLVGAGVDIINGAAYEYPTPITVKFADVRPVSAKQDLRAEVARKAPAAGVVLESQGCVPSKPPSAFKTSTGGQYYEAFCADGRLMHLACSDDGCRLRTSADR